MRRFALLLTFVAVVALTAGVCTATVVSASGSTTSATDLKLPSGFVGQWRGNPTHTVFGPLNGPFNFTIAEVSGHDGTMWRMQDFFNGYLGNSSIQQFWVKSTPNVTDGAATSNLTYCGNLLSFFESAPGGAFVQVNLTETKRTANTMQWRMAKSEENAPWHVPWTGLWTLTLKANGTQLESTFMLPAQTVVHFSALYDRVGDQAPIELPASLASNATDCRLPFDGVPSTAAGERRASRRRRGSGKCPFGFDRDAVPNSAASARRALQSVADTHEHCYLVNPALNFSVAWNWNTSGETIDIVVTTTALPGDPSDHYIALGFYPQWPAMQGMDIALGYLTFDGATGMPAGCVRSMYAEYYVGTPVPNPSQKLTKKSVWTSNGLLHIGFSRPWVSGHTDLSRPEQGGIPVISFATGRVGRPTNATTADVCSGEPQYHGGHRGTYGMLFPQPSAAMPNFMKCNP